MIPREAVKRKDAVKVNVHEIPAYLDRHPEHILKQNENGFYICPFCGQVVDRWGYKYSCRGGCFIKARAVEILSNIGRKKWIKGYKVPCVAEKAARLYSEIMVPGFDVYEE